MTHWIEMGDTVMTLWILFCRMTEKWNTLFTFYVKDREDAERQAETAHGMRNEIAKLGKKRGKLDKSKEMCLLVEKEVHVSVS